MSERLPFPHPPPDIRVALNALVARDARLAGIEQRAGPLAWRTRPPGMAGLLQAIVGQQISNQAAAAIWGRLRCVEGALEPNSLMVLPDEVLRSAGLSRPKIAHARALAAAFVDGRLDALALRLMDDEAAVAVIAAVPGMGRWTAEVYLLFAESRMDVFPSGDLALAASFADLTRQTSRPSPKSLLASASAWQPWRGLAARLLWHHWRHITGRPAMDDVIA
jgi:DNA-3-methyladenine glycosylase II